MRNIFDELYDQFLNGELDVEKYFNDYDTFFKILDRRGLLPDINTDINNSENWQNHYLLYLYNADRIDLFNYYINKFLSDVESDESGDYYLVLDRLSDLSDLFCDNRNSLSTKTIAGLLDGESDSWDWFNETTDDIYRDVIQELNKENLDYLKEYIVKELKDTQISPETEELELIAEEQGHDEYLFVNEENISRILDDEESTNYLLENELEDLNSTLGSLHHSSYCYAYEETVYEEIWDELSRYFSGKPTFFETFHSYKKDTTVQKVKLKINNFISTILEYLNDAKDYGNSGTLEYNGYFLGYLKENADCLKVYPPDYPSHTKVDDNINSYFNDYL